MCSLRMGGWGVILFCIKLRFVLLMLQIKVIYSNNTYSLGALCDPHIFTQNKNTKPSIGFIQNKQIFF